jgi:hypothetical protein
VRFPPRISPTRLPLTGRGDLYIGMDDASLERFCSQCGVSLIPLEVPHTSSTCSTCGRMRHYVRPGKDGKGMQIEVGETVTLPAGWLTLSFDPALACGRLSRAGVPFLLKQLFTAGMPEKPADLVGSIDLLREQWQKDLEQSDKLAGIRLDTPAGGDLAFKRLEEEKDSHEWHVLMKDLSADVALDAVGEKDALKAAHAGLYTGLFHGLSVVTEPYFQEMIWRGYVAGLTIHESGEAAGHVPGEAEALQELDPVFKNLGEATLRTWVDSNSPIGPRIGIGSISEPVLLARAKWHLEVFKREREEQTARRAESRAKSELWIKWLTLGLAIGGAVGALIGKIT